MNLADTIARLFPKAARGFAPSLGRAKPQAVWLRARRALAWFVVAALALQVAAFLAIDMVWPQLRDPEYSRRVASLKERVAEHPGRPLVLAIGSSRMSMGIRPAAWEDARPNRPGEPDLLLFNMSLVGSGPVMELMCLRRLYADGVRPAAVVLEYWPAFLREDAQYFEPDRIDHARLSDRDRSLVEDYFWSEHRNPTETGHEMVLDRLQPLFRNRHRLIAQWCPRWQPWDKRMDMSWGGLDGWGWLSGIDNDPAMRPLRLAHCEPIYREQFKGFTIHPIADRALRETVALARANGAKVALAYMPEGSEFRSWTPPEVERAAHDHLTGLCRELDLPLIDARLWMPDDRLVDGFHLSRDGAAEFTRRFAPAVVEALPDLGGPP